MSGDVCILLACEKSRLNFRPLCQDHDAQFTRDFRVSIRGDGPTPNFPSWVKHGGAFPPSPAPEEEVSRLTDQLAAQAEAIDRLTGENAHLRQRLALSRLGDVLDIEAEIARAKADAHAARADLAAARAAGESFRREAQEARAALVRATLAPPPGTKDPTPEGE